MFTANNFAKWGRVLPLFFSLLFFTLSLDLSAQKISKHYTVSQQKNGSIYFIEPEYGFENRKANTELVFDMTFLTSEDSVKLNFSFISPEIISIDSIAFLLSQKNIGSRAEKIFIEDEKKVWKHRYSSDFLFEDMNDVFLSIQSPQLAVYYQGQTTLLSMKQRKWNKEREVVAKILKLIQVN